MVSPIKQGSTTMDLYSTADLGFVKMEIERRYGRGRHHRKGSTPSHTVILRARARERARISGLGQAKNR
jgi:hypothetical protein